MKCSENNVITKVKTENWACPNWSRALAKPMSAIHPWLQPGGWSTNTSPLSVEKGTFLDWPKSTGKKLGHSYWPGMQQRVKESTAQITIYSWSWRTRKAWTKLLILDIPLLALRYFWSNSLLWRTQRPASYKRKTCRGKKNKHLPNIISYRNQEGRISSMFKQTAI